MFSSLLRDPLRLQLESHMFSQVDISVFPHRMGGKGMLMHFERFSEQLFFYPRMHFYVCQHQNQSNCEERGKKGEKKKTKNSRLSVM